MSLFWKIIGWGWISILCCAPSFAEIESAEMSIMGRIKSPPALEACHIELLNSNLDLGEVEQENAQTLKGEVIVKISCNTPRIVGFSIKDIYGASTSSNTDSKKNFLLNEQKDGRGLVMGYYSIQPTDCHQLTESGDGVLAYLADREGEDANQNPILAPDELYIPIQMNGKMAPSRGFFGTLKITIKPNKTAVGEIYGLATLNLDYF